MPVDSLSTYAIPGFREPICSLSHLTGAVVFGLLAPWLIARRRGRRGWTISLIILGVASVTLLSLSGVYHMLWPGVGRQVMLRLDVAGVYVLIAATITPIHVILFHGWAQWGPVALAWFLAIAGLTLRLVFFDYLPPAAGTLGFLILGWGGVFSCIVLWRRHGWPFVQPLFYGGVAYTVGAIVLSVRWPVLIQGVIGPHELWHFAVLAGLGFHWIFVFRVAANRIAALRPESPAAMPM
ncbi:MAG: hemolysin III family protein [Planctomycetales bacterium]|nr:hemolysin III family protein [Planctomycetales bacterium]